MGATTNIEWTDATWNPIRGCSRVSEGCRNCYAEKVAYRFSGPGQPYERLVRVGADGKRRPEWNGRVRFVEEHLLDPLRSGPVQWKEYVDNDPLGQFSIKVRPRRVFVNSMSDLFHENVPDEWIDRIFAVMALCPQHTFQILTKRPERMLKWFNRTESQDRGYCTMPAADSVAGVLFDEHGWSDERCLNLPWPLPNVWLGVSVEDQKTADERIPLLLETPAAVRFISAEPLIGPVMPWLTLDLSGALTHSSMGAFAKSTIDWVICGGESGPGARPMHPDWARSLRDQCQAAGVPFFFKQWGEWKPGAHGGPFSEPPKPFMRIDLSGRNVTDLSGLWDASDALFWKEGKKAAGALLDGREWREFPEVRG